MSFAIDINTEFPSLLYQLITMNTMISAILLSLLAVASADSLKIVNNCAADFEISSISTSSERVLCFEMKKIAVGNQIAIDDFDYDEIMLLKSSAKPDSNSFTYIDTLENLIENQDDIGGECAKLVKSGNVKAYSVEPGVPHLTLCANEPSPTPPSPKQNTITNKCSNKFEFAHFNHSPGSKVVCSPSIVIPGGKQLSYISGTPDFVIIKTASTKDTPNFAYLETLQSVIDLYGDANGECQKLINSGFNAVYEPTRAHMTLCA